MQFDPVIALVLSVIVGLLSYIYYLHRQRTAQPAVDLTQLTAAVYDESLFSSPFSEKEAYVATKRQLLAAAGKADGEQSVSDLAAEARKQLDGLMLKRAVAAIERGNAINRELDNVRAMQANGLLTPPQVQSIQAAIHAVEAEQRDVRQEADVVRHKWGDVIFRQAYAMSPSGIAAMKESRDRDKDRPADGQQPAGQGQGQGQHGPGQGQGHGRERVAERQAVGARAGAAVAAADRGEPARMSKQEEEELKRKQARSVKEADKAFDSLMREEERAEKKGSKKKDDAAGGAGSKKGSKK